MRSEEITFGGTGEIIKAGTGSVTFGGTGQIVHSNGTGK